MKYFEGASQLADETYPKFDISDEIPTETSTPSQQTYLIQFLIT
jgi:hypothetical protein